MAKYLISTSETYRVDNENEAKILIEEARQDDSYTLAKYSCVHKEKKSKGQVEDEWERVTLVKQFNSETNPEDIVDIEYSKE